MQPAAPTRVRVFAPATVANVAAAFDILGFAVSEPGDVVEAWISGRPGVRLAEITGDGGVLPREPERNTATAVVKALLDHTRSEVGIEIRLEKGLPLCSGLGSSAASSAAAVLAVNRLLGEPLKRQELLPFVIATEAVALTTSWTHALSALVYGHTANQTVQGVTPGINRHLHVLEQVVANQREFLLPQEVAGGFGHGADSPFGLEMREQRRLFGEDFVGEVGADMAMNANGRRFAPTPPVAQLAVGEGG